MFQEEKIKAKAFEMNRNYQVAKQCFMVEWISFKGTQAAPVDMNGFILAGVACACDCVYVCTLV